MSEVVYHINNKPFKDFGVYVSESHGLADSLKRVKPQEYYWSEYSGLSVDLSKVRFESREIELKCFIEGNNWEVMRERFYNFTQELTKKHTQRLHIKPFNHEILPYEVYHEEEINLEKTFKEGQMFGTFSLKFIEPNPIKRVLKTTLDEFNLSYKCISETEIFFGDGTKQTARGDVNLVKRYNAPSYQNSGFSLVQESAINNSYYEVYTAPLLLQPYFFSVTVNISEPKDLILYIIGRKPNNTYELVTYSGVFQAVSGLNSITLVHEMNISDYGKFIFKVLDDEGNEVTGISFSNPRIETAEVIGEWQDMTGKEKIIIIAGNIEEISDFSTEAEIIWDKI